MSKQTKMFHEVLMKAGLYEIRALCDKGGTFSSDDLSDALRTVACNRISIIGALFTKAVNNRGIVKVGEEPSKRPGARGRKVSVYRPAVGATWLSQN